MDLAALAEFTEGYSGADIVLLAKEAAMRPVRRLLDQVDMDDISSADGLRLDAICPEDIAAALQSVRPSASLYKERYETWQAEFGATSSGGGV